MIEDNPRNQLKSRPVHIKIPNKMFPQDFFHKSTSESPTKSLQSCKESPVKKINRQIIVNTNKQWSLIKNDIDLYKIIKIKQQPQPHKNTRVFSQKKQRINRLLKQQQSSQSRPVSQLTKKLKFNQTSLQNHPFLNNIKKFSQPEFDQGFITFFGKNRNKCRSIHLPPIK